MHADAARDALRAPGAAAVPEVADQFLLLRIHGDTGLVPLLVSTYAVGEVSKLGVAIRMLAALARLRVALQAITQRVQGFSDAGVADRVADRLQRRRQDANALTRPAERRLRIAGRRRLDERIQIPEERGVEVGQRLAAATGATRVSGRQRDAGL